MVSIRSRLDEPGERENQFSFCQLLAKLFQSAPGSMSRENDLVSRVRDLDRKFQSAPGSMSRENSLSLPPLLPYASVSIRSRLDEPGERRRRQRAT